MSKTKLLPHRARGEEAVPAPERDHAPKLDDDWRKRLDQKAHEITALKRELNSSQKLVIGMAKGGYGFDPKVARSAVVKRIADHLRTLGIALDEGTILNALRRAAELLHPGD